MKNQLLTFALLAAFFKSVFIPQFASAQNSRIWGTYYGGKGQDYGTSVATDASGNVYLAGATENPGLASGGFQDSLEGAVDAFLVKFDANGNRLWATYYGTGITQGLSVATDAAGNVYLAGYTQDTTGIASGGVQNIYPGGYIEGFLVKFDANGNRLWATYYGGTGYENIAVSVATDASGNVYLAGLTTSTDSIASGGFQNTFVGSGDAFLVKFDANGNRLWATYYGGGTQAYMFTYANAVSTDASGNVFMTGHTSSTDSIAFGGFQNTYGGGDASAFLVKFNANGNRLWATYYGGAAQPGGGVTEGNGVATDASGNVYMTGETVDSAGIAFGGFQNTFGGYQPTYVKNDAYLVKFDPNGNRLWATYYGASGDDLGKSVATDAAGNVWLAGVTNSTDSIASGGFQNTEVVDTIIDDAATSFLVKFDADGNRKCATYYGSIQSGIPKGGPANEGVALDNAGNVYLASYTLDSSGTDIASGGFQNTYGGNQDAFLVKFCPCSNCIIIPVANFQSSDSTLCAPECINYSDSSTNVTSWQWSFPGGAPSSSTSQNPQGICYNSAGTFNTTLIASNNVGSDTITFTNFIKVFVSPPTPVITQHHDTLFCSTDPSYTSYQWYDSTTIIPGATGTFFVVAHDGTYNVKVSNETGCQKIAAGGITIINVGFNEFSANNYISLSPNPASDQLFIYTSSRITGKAIISIINVLGQDVLSFSLPFGEGRGGALDIKNIPPGIYFLQIKTEVGMDTKRFVKE